MPQSSRYAQGFSFLLISYVLLSACFAPAFASWPPTGRAVSTSPSSDQLEAVCPDGHGGVIVSWVHNTMAQGGPRELRVQRVDADGTARWPATTDGKPITSSGGRLGGTRLLADDAGCYIAWLEERESIDHLFLLHLEPDGATSAGWPANGLPIGKPLDHQVQFDLASDEEGGVFLVWQNWAGAICDLYGARVTRNAVSAPGWSLDGRTVCGAVGIQSEVSLIADGAGGAVICWRDTRRDAPWDLQSPGDIFALRIGADGSPAMGWAEDGLGIGVADDEQDSPVLVPDGTGGAIVSWWDSRGDASGQLRGVFAARVDGTGRLRWGREGGIPVDAAGGWPGRPIAVSDLAGGAYVVWPDAIDGYAKLSATHLDGSGQRTTGWTSGGNPVYQGLFSSAQFNAIGDGRGGLYVAWTAYESSGYMYRVRLQSLTPTASRRAGFPEDGLVVHEGSEFSSVTQGPIGAQPGSIAVARSGDVFLSWTDARDGSEDTDVYVQRVPNGGGSSAAPGIGSLFLMGNPIHRFATFRMRLPSSGETRLEVFDSQGRVRHTQQIRGSAGEVVRAMADLSGLPAGIYLARCRDSEGGSTNAIRVALVR